METLEAKEQEYVLEAARDVVAVYTGFFADVDNDKKVNRKNDLEGQYTFIPSDPDFLEFYRLRQYFKSYSPSFLDAGCGIGNIMIMASTFGFKVTGIECDNRNLKIARRLFNGRRLIYTHHRPFFIKGDILKFENYHEYDVIYCYHPLRDYALEAQFETKIMCEMKVGAYFWRRMPQTPPIRLALKPIPHYGYSNLCQKVAKVAPEMLPRCPMERVCVKSTATPSKCKEEWWYECKDYFKYTETYRNRKAVRRTRELK